MAHTMRIGRSCWFVVLLVGMMLLTGGVISAQEEDLTTVRIVEQRFLTYAPIHIANLSGFFAEQGIQLEAAPVDPTQTAQIVAAMLRDELDVYVGTISADFFNVIAREADLRLVANNGYLAADGCSYISMLAQPELLASGALDDSDSVSGMRVATFEQGYPGYLMDLALQQHDLTLADFEVPRIDSTVLGEAFTNDGVDIAHAAEPFLSSIVNSGAAESWYDGNVLAPDFSFNFIIFAPSLLAREDDLGVRFLLAYLNGVAQYNEGKTDENIAILEEKTGLAPERLEAACFPQMRPDGRGGLDSLIDFQEYAVRMGFVDEVIPPETFWDGSYIDAANELFEAQADS